MNKHGVLLDMLVDKILFVPGRCDHDGNVISFVEELTFIKPEETHSKVVIAPKSILKRDPTRYPTVQ